MKRSLRLLLIVLAATCGPALAAHADYTELPLEQRAAGADLIVEGVVVAVNGVRWQGSIYSDITVAIDSTIKASSHDAATITFRTLGGTIGDVQMYTMDSERFYGNERVIVLLNKRPDGDGWWLIVPGNCFYIGEGSVVDRAARASILAHLVTQTTASLVAPISWGSLRSRR